MGRRLVSPWWAVGLGMILGGAMGNLVDRFFRSPGPLRGHVVDFLSIGWWPVFNVADPSVVGGAILLVTLSALGFDFDTVGHRRGEDELDLPAVVDAHQAGATPDQAAPASTATSRRTAPWQAEGVDES